LIPDARDVLGGWEPSSARTQGAPILDECIAATEDAAMRRFPAAATPPLGDTPQPDVQARGDWESII